MNIVGIIAEYNPFHQGHAWHLKEARRLTGASYAVVAMSGNYVQRGTPAMFDKYTRARAALSNGADLILELPPVSRPAARSISPPGPYSFSRTAASSRTCVLEANAAILPCSWDRPPSFWRNRPLTGSF